MLRNKLLSSFIFMRHQSNTINKSPISIGIRQETKNRWECRVPLTPKNLEELGGHGIRFIVQPCTRRVFPDAEFSKVGAIVQEDLSECDLIVGVKEVPITDLLPDKHYLFFSHTHKAQSYNMPLLRAICDKKITLLDYELLVDEQGQRLVAFGQFAGYAGMINCLHGLGDRLLSLNYRTPLLNIALSHNYPSMAEVKRSIAEVGERIASSGLPKDLTPLVFVFTGNGNVSKGAQEIFKLLPHEFIPPSELASVVKDKARFGNKFVGCIVNPEDYMERRSDAGFTPSEYYSKPSLYKSTFHERIAPHASVIVNGIYWDTRFPRLLTKQQAIDSCPRLLAVCDISCDIEGSIEFTDRATSIDAPFYYYNPKTDTSSYEPNQEGIQMMTVDNLPTQLPQDASEYFGQRLTPVMRGYLEGGLTDSTISRATITKDGQIDARFKHQLQPIVDRLTPRRVLILGAGYVAAPVIEYLRRFPNCFLTIASPTFSGLGGALLGELKRAGNVQLVQVALSKDKLDGEVEAALEGCDVVISLLPATMHPWILDAVLEKKKHLVTASYTSPAMQEYAGRVEAAGLVWLNEMGLDPGLDHMSAMRLINEIKAEGGEIESFESWCGGLPAPEAAGNPLGYKFSWSPRGVLLAAQSPARYIHDGKEVSVAGEELLGAARPVRLHPALALEGLPNRDSLRYIPVYGLSTSALKGMFRGTLRYSGFSAVMDVLRRLGFLDASSQLEGVKEWPQAVERVLGISSLQQLPKALSEKLGISDTFPLVEAFRGLGLLTNAEPYDASQPSRLDSLCALLQRRLQYSPHERDLCFMQHNIIARRSDASRDLHTSQLMLFGDEKYSAMAKTVGLPVAIAARMILEGDVFRGRAGVLIPTERYIYEPVLEECAREGIVFTETRRQL